MDFFTGGIPEGCLLYFFFFEKGGNDIHFGGGLRGSALSLADQRWEAVFRRERMPASIDRTSVRYPWDNSIYSGSAADD